MKPNINTMKLTLTTRTKAALLVVLYSTFLMSFSSFAAPKDTVAKANACCTTKTVAKVVDTPAAVKHTGTENTDPNAAPEMTNALARETGLPAENNGPVYYATTQTIHLQSTVTSNATNGSMSVKAPHFASESRAEASPTKKSEGAAVVERLVGLMAGALFCVMAVMSSL